MSSVPEKSPDGQAERDTSDETAPSLASIRRQFFGLVVAVVLFGVAVGLSNVASRFTTMAVGAGGSGAVSRLLVSVFALQVVGFGSVAVLFLATRNHGWRSYVRVGTLTQWTVFYGVAVGLALMVLTVCATLLFTLADIAPAEAAVGQADDPRFYLVLFVVSTFLAVPMEEVFFRGILQRSLAEAVHPALAIGVASVLFASVHTSVSVGAGGELLALLLFVSFGIALGTSYHVTGNLLVPVIGHAMFNGIQILVRTVEVLG